MFGKFLDAHPLEEMIRSMPVCPFPSMQDRAAWAGIASADRDDLLALHDSLRDTPYPLLTASRFMAFVRDGSRKAYEEPYFLRRRKLIAAAMHMCVTGTQTALDDVIDGIWCICEESSWVISAHNVNSHPGAPEAKKKPLPLTQDRYIDLFAAQTAMILSLVSAMTCDALDDAAPEIRRRISREIEARILIPFMTRDDFWWMGFIRKDLCNWTPWIVSNVLMTASLEMRSAREFAGLCDRALRMVDRWLDVVPDDGGCDEGVAYYNMAGGALLDCLALMERVTGGRMTLWHEEKIRNILAFPLAAELENGWFVNFADCDARPSLCGERLVFAGGRLNMPELCALGARYRGMPSAQIADVPHFSRLLERLFQPSCGSSCTRKAARDVYLPDLQLRVYEKDGLILCAKGGHNGESHNHNDVGSFMLYADGEPEILDAGNMVYTSKTFVDETRYTLFNTRSKNHNLPLIGECEQLPGAQRCARDVSRLGDGLALDIAPAYGSDAGVLRCERTLRLGCAMTVHDHIELVQEKPVTWVFMLRHEPKADGKWIRMGKLRLAHDARLDLAIEEIPVTDARMVKNYPGSIWRLTLTAPAAKAHDETFTIERADSHE